MMNLYGRVFTPLQTAHVHVLAYPYECSALSLLDAIATGDEGAAGMLVSCKHHAASRQRWAADGCQDAAGDHGALIRCGLLQGRSALQWRRRQSCCSRAS
jgi:hypothetical protein